MVCDTSINYNILTEEQHAITYVLYFRVEDPSSSQPSDRRSLLCYAIRMASCSYRSPVKNLFPVLLGLGFYQFRIREIVDTHGSADIIESLRCRLTRCD